MFKMLQKASWTIALRGLVAIAFGIVLFVWPGITLTVLIKAFAIYAFVVGAVVVFGALRNRDEVSNWVTLMLLGLFSIFVGIFMFAQPQLTELAFLYLLAAYALVTGVLDIAVGFQVRREVQNEWLVILAGVVSALFGIIVFARPTESAVAIIWLVSLYAVVHGVLTMAFAFRVHGLAKEVRRIED